jgi:DNA-binding NarL/FixJ family response regulator
MKKVEDNILAIMSTQLTERELIFFHLVESGMTTRDIADRLGISHMGVSKVYWKAKNKMAKFADLGLFSTALK